ncbi:MAG: hypothetical protein U0360_08445 [Dehalococcoidia bacterium]
MLLGTTASVAVAGIALAVWQRRDWLAGPGSFWTAWCATGLVMFSFSNRAAAQYTEAYAPALVVLAALGLVEAWRLAGRRGLGLASLLLALALLTEVGAALHPPLRDRLVAAAIIEGASAAVVVLVALCGRWLRGRLTIITGASAAALATPVVTSMWIAFEAPREARDPLPNPLVYASAARPEPYVPLPIAAIDALPERPGARYRLAIDGISRSGETIALTGESVLPVWNEFLRAPVLDGSDLDELFARGDVPWVVLSRQLVASGLLRELQSHIERFCIAATGRGFGPGWLLYRCAPAPSSP